MMKAIWTIACNDLLRWRRQPVAIASALVPPIVMALFLVVLSFAVTQQPVALVALGKGPLAEQMAEIIRSDDDAYLLSETDAASAARLLKDQEVAAVITVPADFEENVNNGRVAKVKLLLNNVDIDFADDIRRSVDRSVYRFILERNKPPTEEEIAEVRRVENEKNETAADELREAEVLMRRARGDNPYLIRIDEKDLRKTDVEWLHYQVVPALVLLVLNVGLVGTALLCAEDIERRTAAQLILAPQHPVTLVAGKILGGFIACMLVLIPALLLCVVTGTVAPVPGHWPALMAIFAATALFASGAGATIGAVLNGARVIVMAACVIATYLFLLGGGFTTIAFLPEWLRTISAFTPSRYAIDGMRQALFYDTLDGVPTDLIVLCSTAVVCCLLASLFVRRVRMS